MEKPTIRNGIRWLIFMAIGGGLIMAVMSVPMHFADRAAEQRIEKLREERVEELKERYGF